jgi:hypothetical protein
VKELAAPGVTFGYIGNANDGAMTVSLRPSIFLPHPGRVGSLADSVSIGRTEKLPEAVTNWHALAGLARRRITTARSASYKRRHKM